MTRLWGYTAAACLIAVFGLVAAGSFRHDPLLEQTAWATVIAAGVGACGIKLAQLIHLLQCGGCDRCEK